MRGRNTRIKQRRCGWRGLKEHHEAAAPPSEGHGDFFWRLEAPDHAYDTWGLIDKIEPRRTRWPSDIGALAAVWFAGRLLRWLRRQRPKPRFLRQLCVDYGRTPLIKISSSVELSYSPGITIQDRVMIPLAINARFSSSVYSHHATVMLEARTLLHRVYSVYSAPKTMKNGIWNINFRCWQMFLNAVSRNVLE